MARATTRTTTQVASRTGAEEYTARDVTLYILRPDMSAAEALAAGEDIPTSSTDAYDFGFRTIEGWVFRSISPARTGRHPVNISLDDLPDAITAMLDIWRALDGGNQLPYVIVHVERLHRRGVKRGKGERSARDPAGSLAVKVAVRTVLDTLDPLRPGEPRGYYRQYDDMTRRTGYLAVGPRASVLLDLSDRSFAILATLLQSGILDASGWIATQSLDAVIARVSQWSANQDVRESVDEVTALKHSGDIATRGQVWLSYALAVVGVVLSFFSFVKHPVLLSPSLILLTLSCVAQAAYAQGGGDRWHMAGVVLFWVAIVLSLAGGITSQVVGNAALPFQL